MKLRSLLSAADCSLMTGTWEKEISSLAYHSDNCEEGTLFFAIKGEKKDGRLFLNEAWKKGARCFVIQKEESAEKPDINRLSDSTVVYTDDIRRVMAKAARLFYDKPDENLLTIAVTGTKGKTTTTFMIKELLEAGGIKTGIMGTVLNGYESNFTPAEATTPEAVEIMRYFHRMKWGGCKAVVMEVSSQSVKMKRTEGIFFDFCVFTNISPDHIGKGEHASFEEYYDCKAKLLSNCKRAVVNMDDSLCEKAAKHCKASQVTGFSIKNNSAFTGKNIQPCMENSSPGIEYDLKGDKIHLSIPGEFNVKNSLAAIATARSLGIDMETVKGTLRNIKVPGRCEEVKISNRFTVLLDYAHNGVALRNLLESLKIYNPRRLTVMFGCGGNRDKARRSEMGEAASRFADFTIITSDNPRDEDPMKIIEDIQTAMDKWGGKYIVIPNRREAIRWTADNALDGDMIVIAGKGHETYQIIGNEKKHFDDREELLARRRGKEDEDIYD